MRYPKEHKEQTRQRIIETASHNFRERGIDGEGIASVMAGSGLTNGAFFNHFDSKEDLARAVVEHSMAERAAFLDERIRDRQGVERFVRGYLSVRHRDHGATGCPVAALAPDISRHSHAVRGAFTEGLGGLIDVLVLAWPDIPRRTARGKALALYGLISGCLQMARATDDPKLSTEILSGGTRAALDLVAS